MRKELIMESDQQIGAKEFLEELRNLCRKHRVLLATSYYDGLEIRNLEDGIDPIHFCGIADSRGDVDEEVE